MEEQKIIKKSTMLAGRELTIETGKMARQANGSIFMTYGDTSLLVTATMAPTATEGIDFFPLTVDYVEKMFAAGKIPGGFFKREAKPSTQATLLSRLIDRSIRPLFPEGFRNPVHVVLTTLSYDEMNDPGVLGILGASLALGISDIPFSGPLAGVGVGLVDDQFVINPSMDQLKESKLDLSVAGTGTSVVMIEAGASEISEEKMMEAIYYGHDAIKELVEFQKEFIAECGKSKMEVTLKVIPQELTDELNSEFGQAINEATKIAGKQERNDRFDELRNTMIEKYVAKYDEKEFAEKEPQLKEALESLIYKYFRDAVLNESRRVDGRRVDEIRDIRCEIDVLPRVHGSALFTRGETQSIGTVTLGTATDEQIIDGLEEEYKKPYFLHYNFPPFSVGEAGFLRPPGRRELGHGALAERALSAVMPTREEFPYTIRMVSDILESNGSSSMATVCSGCLALMAAGVPVKKIVAGIANGLVMEGDKSIVLTDIIGMEDHLGDMDFKVTGTVDGITAMQMDIKIEGITKEVMAEALEQARKSRLHIIEIMRNTISESRKELSKYAPRIESFKVDVDKIGTIIGPGGKTIKAIIEETKVAIDISDDGTVNISSADGFAIEKAKQKIKELTDEPEMGEIYEGVVSRVEPFGAFVKFMGGFKEGLVHVSQLHYSRVESAHDFVKIGDVVRVKYTGSDRGKVQLTMKGVPGNEAYGTNLPPADESRSRSYDQNRSGDRPRYDRDRRDRSSSSGNRHRSDRRDNYRKDRGDR
ncbi:MAG: polyribonucleotide nucleotidyltransferase [Candidatus Cloacimonetes bacterium]|nr:polyribonucleotide nucleotidyltransferase [Candidatus Cloacimonadota bacterium]